MKDQTSIYHTYNQFLQTLIQARKGQYGATDSEKITAAILAHAQVTQPHDPVEKDEDVFVPENKDLTSLYGGGQLESYKFNLSGVEYKVWVDHRGPYRDEFFFYNEARSQSPMYACHPDDLYATIDKAWHSFSHGQKCGDEINKWNSDI